MDIRDGINEYTNSINKGDFSSPDVICQKCCQKPTIYKLHESRKRQLRVVVMDIVEVMITFLLRWKCSICGKTFTQYPAFMLPHKRFVLSDIKQFGGKYLAKDDSSYADIVKYDGADIGYRNEEGLCDQFLSPSSVWRFIQYLACFHHSNYGIELKKHKKPIPSSKYRSNQRKALLHKALKGIIGLGNLENSQIFPHFETGLT